MGLNEIFWIILWEKQSKAQVIISYKKTGLLMLLSTFISPLLILQSAVMLDIRRVDKSNCPRHTLLPLPLFPCLISWWAIDQTNPSRRSAPEIGFARWKEEMEQNTQYTLTSANDLVSKPRARTSMGSLWKLSPAANLEGWVVAIKRGALLPRGDTRNFSRNFHAIDFQFRPIVFDAKRRES